MPINEHLTVATPEDAAPPTTRRHLPSSRHTRVLAYLSPALLALLAACGSTETDPPQRAGTGATSSGGAAPSGGSGGGSGSAGSGASTGTGGQQGGQGGGSAGGTDTGGTDAGGAPSTGGASGAGGDAGSPPTGPVGEVGDLGAACSPPASLACAGNFQKVALICDASGTWEVNQTCPGDQICDTRPGVSAGTCQDQDPACIDREPGFQFCVDNSIHECGPDNLDYAEVEQCTGMCEEGICNNNAAPCPTEGMIANCADDCGGPSECPAFGVAACHQALVRLNGAIGDAFVVRMQAESDVCTCTASGRSYVGIVDDYAGAVVRITVPEPWGIFDVSTGEVGEACTPGLVGPRCLVSPIPNPSDPLRSRTIRLATDERVPDPKNITIEIVEPNAVCP